LLSRGCFITLADNVVATVLSSILNLPSWLSFPGAILYSIFNLWMFVDAIRRREYFWAVLIFFGLGFWYFLSVFRGSVSPTQGFELPGAHNRKRIRELQAKIHHLDNAVHYFQLGDIYFQQGKLDKAEPCYRAALERDPRDIDARAHLGQCLLRQKKPAEAKPLLEGVVAENPRHDYGYSMMALAEALTALGEKASAKQVWLQVTAANSYPRAKVQLAELYLADGQTDLAKNELKEILADDDHAPAFQRKRDRVWTRRARSLARTIG